MERGSGRWGWALLLACPACAGGFFLAVAAAFGVTAAVLKGVAVVALAVLVGVLWARNAWQRRNESCAPCAASGASPRGGEAAASAAARDPPTSP